MPDDAGGSGTVFILCDDNCEQLLCCGAEVGRVEDTIRRICLAYGATRADVFLSHPVL